MGSLLLAQALPTGTEAWIERGILGLVVLAIIMGWLTPGIWTKQEASRADRLEEENNRLRQVAEDQWIPLMVRTMDVLERSQELDRRSGGSAAPYSQRRYLQDEP